MTVAEIITDPEAYMRRKTRRDRYGAELLLVILLGTLGAIGPLYYAQLMRRTVENPSDTFQYQLLGVVLVPFVMVFGAWIIYSVVAHVLAERLYDGRGRFGRLFRLTAWALLPLAIGYLARSIALVVTFWSMSRGDLSAEIADAEAGREIIVGFEAGVGHPTVLAGTVVLALSILWSGYTLSFAIERATGIARGDAIKIAMLPAVVYASYELGDAVLTAGYFSL